MNNIDIRSLLEENATQHYGLTFSELSPRQRYRSVVRVTRDILSSRRKEFNRDFKSKNIKRVHYISMEFLLGRSLKNNLFNLGLEEQFRSVLSQYGVKLDDVYESEPDAGLGNGGLGRLAACYMDSLATLGYPAMGHCLFFEYGLFTQKIVDGWQIELPDEWLLNGGDVWFRQRSDKMVTVRFGGEVKESFQNGKMVHTVENATEVEALPYDMVLSGYGDKGVAVLRLWQARSKRHFDMSAFDQGRYLAAMKQDNEAELITKVLYPADNHEVGRELRLKQEYFLCSAAMQNVVGDFFAAHQSLEQFTEQVAVHINDTHPAMCIPELMRIFLDEYGMEWDDAWKIVKSVCAYTNHTVMAEALERWPEFLVEKLLPRIYQIIKEINRRICEEYFALCGDMNRVADIAIISYSCVKMANLSVAGSHSVNGVSALHSDIIKKTQFADFYAIEPQKFTNVTNGVAYRRWLCQSNPELSSFLCDCIGKGFLTDANELQKFNAYVDDKAVLDKLWQIKLDNKRRLAAFAAKQGAILNPETRFDVQAKRLHEYKRQLLNVMKIISLYHDIKENPQKDVTPQTFIFAAKAASSYTIAKQIIKLICKLGEDIASNPVARDKLAVVFLQNYCVTMAETLIPAAEVSEQISLAGKEASGTGNMKFMFNGALTVGTLDGANVEISESVGEDNIFIFGKTDKEVERLWTKGYSSTAYYLKQKQLRDVVEELNQGFAGVTFENISSYLLNNVNGVADPYMCFADYMDYMSVCDRMDEAYRDKERWQKMSLKNIAEAGRFSADYSVKEYADKIWKI